MSEDILSDVLDAVRLTGAVFYWIEATHPWIAVAVVQHRSPGHQGDRTPRLPVTRASGHQGSRLPGL
ncbi:MAG: hypothetical protein AB7F35_26730 [Acetobacteraceae bacterium]